MNKACHASVESMWDEPVPRLIPWDRHSRVSPNQTAPAAAAKRQVRPCPPRGSAERAHGFEVHDDRSLGAVLQRPSMSVAMKKSPLLARSEFPFVAGL